jgi:hypothetical protein
MLLNELGEKWIEGARRLSPSLEETVEGSSRSFKLNARSLESEGTYAERQW